MSRVYDRPILIQQIDEITEQWGDCYTLHAKINKPKNNSEYLGGGAVQGKRTLTFEVRYFAALEDIALNTQGYRILYNEILYNITDYDDYMLRHKTVTLLGVSY